MRDHLSFFGKSGFIMEDTGVFLRVISQGFLSRQLNLYRPLSSQSAQGKKGLSGYGYFSTKRSA